MSHLLTRHNSRRTLTTLVENRTTYHADWAELNIFETHDFAEKVELQFGFPVIASMLSGKKIMHIEGLPAFDFYPGESVVMPSYKKMVIDFPLASFTNPTKCLALGIEESKIKAVVSRFNEHVQIENENNTWSIDSTANHLINNPQINQLIERLVVTFTNNNRSKDLLLDFMIQELIVRLLQTRAKSILLNETDLVLDDNRIGMVIKFIKDNLTNKDITVDILAEKACMSTSHFHKKFKSTLGVSPIDYINAEKIKFSKKLIKESKDFRVSDIAFKTGFNNISYFNRQFKKLELMTPLQFKKSISA
ncbi:AraC family transcriptional regulator [Formosa sp. S-31]|uniref:AraC family transcriptional regulator n=1 Tax=Formosa sp. S-31 TaxID=2790949 RepID=UPI003EC14B74